MPTLTRTTAHGKRVNYFPELYAKFKQKMLCMILFMHITAIESLNSIRQELNEKRQCFVFPLRHP